MVLFSKTVVSAAARQLSNNCSFTTVSEINGVRNGIQDIMHQVQELRDMIKEAEQKGTVNVPISEVDEMNAKLSKLDDRMNHIHLTLGVLPKDIGTTNFFPDRS
mmetsp:Transcript_8291/g.12767  ORF Transcript_8291/g.12767 Transcript_8291/m.12767 type:complete len:104 (+) Transcript_8291:120-431(+)|eukprot:CAMPEP_0178916152 /NCGR_PEP_ID=MMETSP0786-20121207/12456_1 /TAXON_ID=186022 /ORGANISM="Thalassionema frauenfeldii, Strain CCMP 1798" /LENGTH=103 /DNA_ID=CAMNT_0020589407 /DNA_START=86 /DNA_END=397 /DNA_ORIENTATION=+